MIDKFIFKSAFNNFSARAIPTDVANPCPRGPVVVSTPLVCPNSGWPGVLNSTV